MRRGFVLTSPTKEWEWEGVTHTAIRVGKCAQGREDAVEALSTSSNAITGDVFYFYNTLFTDNGRYVFVEFGGRGPLDEFEQACNTVIESIKVKS